MPMIEEKVKSHPTPFTLIKVNIDKHGNIAEAVGVSSVPHVFLIKNNDTINQLHGLPSPKGLDDFFKSIS